jgi:hypothetical protein
VAAGLGLTKEGGRVEFGPSRSDIDALSCSRHYRQMITTAWQLGGGRQFPGRSRLCKWAHMLGYGGHFLTKSRRYSTTFGVLRRARFGHHKHQRHPDVIESR